MEPSNGKAPAGKAAGWYYSLTTQAATDTAENSGEVAFRKCWKLTVPERKQIKKSKNITKSSYSGLTCGRSQVQVLYRPPL